MKLQPVSVAVVVSNRKKAVQWYRKKLGLDILDQEDHWVTVGSKRRGIRLHLCQTTEFDPKGKLEPGNSGILFQVDADIEEAYRWMKRRGVKFSHPPQKMEWGWFCAFLDPDGNEFWLVPKA